jgi:hypothetical protein
VRPVWWHRPYPMILDTCCHPSQGCYNTGRPLNWQPTLRAFFSFYLYYYLLTKFDTYPAFLNNGRNCDSNGSVWVFQRGKREWRKFRLVSLSFLQDPLCAKRQRASGTDDLDYIPEEAIYDYYKLHVIIYTIVVFWMTIFTPFVESPSTMRRSIVVCSGGKNLSDVGSTTIGNMDSFIGKNWWIYLLNRRINRWM